VTYYNEFDPKAAAWLRELIRAGLIPAGEVDERSISDISPADLVGFRQQHFFAGIGGWAFALRLAGWPDDRPVRTGSCPCQPFSAAGKGLGEEDARHLWPVFRDLITFGEPTVTFGEQVASAAGRVWLARVRADLEGLGYGVGAADLCSAGVGSPNIRQRLFWMAHDAGTRRGRPQPQPEGEAREQARMRLPGAHGGFSGVADANGGERRNGGIQPCGQHGQQPEDGGAVRLGNAGGTGGGRHAGTVSSTQGEGERLGGESRGVADEPVDAGAARGLAVAEYGGRERRDQERSGPGATMPSGPFGFWSAFDVLPCTDGKARRIEPGSFPLAHGVPGRVGLLRGYGNAINPWITAEFILSCEEALN
jgi:DNA (cytosine-5)-methyltransferase 1